MSARDHILGSIRHALGRETGVSAEVAGRLEERLSTPPHHTRPVGEKDRVKRFQEKIEAAGATVQQLNDYRDVAPAIARYLKDNQLPARLVASADAEIANLAWPALLDVETRRANGEDKVSVTSALMAVAEAGTLILTSDPATPTTLNFLPDDHIVVLSEEKVADHLEDAWKAIRARYRALPRTVNLISGPSKTADVEQTIQLGAHGPRRLHVILYSRGLDSGEPRATEAE